MKDLTLRIIELLAYPRLYAVESIDPGQCPRQGRFEPADERCRLCELGAECEWLESGEPFVDLAVRSQEQMLDTLRFALDYVEANNHRSRRRLASCVCESCEWLRQAGQLLREAEGRAVRVHHSA